ncbi:hypothetical protein G7Z17_g13724 [Cylindrodendrum hubeiense]|uniref:Uncharacterized protein n=1 Tax=Cylindrodendrum hubeiense TaxID=595255 RepID=A0A9P5H0G7_9HYPO|nr:hypothetical protein G7Z17_g13724 [Cylindrodendrum hubeiense]
MGLLGLLGLICPFPAGVGVRGHAKQPGKQGPGSDGRKAISEDRRQSLASCVLRLPLCSSAPLLLPAACTCGEVRAWVDFGFGFGYGLGDLRRASVSRSRQLLHVPLPMGFHPPMPPPLQYIPRPLLQEGKPPPPPSTLSPEILEVAPNLRWDGSARPGFQDSWILASPKGPSPPR